MSASLYYYCTSGYRVVQQTCGNQFLLPAAGCYQGVCVCGVCVSLVTASTLSFDRYASCLDASLQHSTRLHSTPHLSAEFAGRNGNSVYSVQDCVSEVFIDNIYEVSRRSAQPMFDIFRYIGLA